MISSNQPQVLELKVPLHLDESNTSNKKIRGQEVNIPIELAINPLNSPNIILLYPGYGGSKNGYLDKYVKLTNHMLAKNIGAVVRMDNFPFKDLNYPVSLVHILNYTLDYLISHSKEICYRQTPRIYGIGVSAGASGFMAVANKHPELKKLLLVVPSMDARSEAVMTGLKSFTGEISILMAKDDKVVGSGAGELCQKTALQAKKIQVVTLNKGGHNLEGTQNGQILSNAPLWAFRNLPSFPTTENGHELY